MKRRWGLLVGGALLIVLVVGAAGWHDLTQARSQLNDARRSLTAVVDNPESLRQHAGRQAALRSVDDAARRLRLARKHVSDSMPLRLVGSLPLLSRQRAGVLKLIADAAVGTETSRQLLTSVDASAERAALQDGLVPLGGLRELEAVVRRAGARFATLQRPTDGLWSSVAEARRLLNDASVRASRSLTNGADAIGATRSLMGSFGPRRYLLAVQNNAEIRDQGMVLSYAVMSFDQGRMVIERSGPIGDLELDTAVDTPVPASTERAFGSQSPRRLWQNVNASADWPTSARSMSAMYRQAAGTEVDGVIAIDVPGIAALLRTLGPVPNPLGGETITADNAGRVLLHDYYVQTAGGPQSVRKERLSEVAATVIGRLTTGKHDAVAIGRELGAAAAGGHFRLWSKDSDEERVFRRTGLGGGPAEHRPDRTVHLSVQNASASKLDYFQTQRIKMDVYVTELGTAVIRTSVTIDNAAPKSASPSYQLGPRGASQRIPGEYVARVYFWGPRGSSQAQGVLESGLLLDSTAVSVQPGTSGTVVFNSAIPRAVRNGRLDLRLVPQPTLTPASLEVRLHASGWSVDGEKTISRAWDRTITVSWGLKS